jgi:hypothetical protein
VGWHLICVQCNFENKDLLSEVQGDVFLFAF